LILNLIYVYKKNLKPWQIGSLFLVFYSIFRIFVEIFFRLPDKNIWYIFSYFTMWELLSLPMLLFWIYYYFRLKIKTK
jgi:phosphatidylglycerol:prolipoprotein diacylglycerol transferase